MQRRRDRWIDAQIPDLLEGEQVMVTVRGTVDEIGYGGVYVTIDRYPIWIPGDVIDTIQVKR